MVWQHCTSFVLTVLTCLTICAPSSSVWILKCIWDQENVVPVPKEKAAKGWFWCQKIVLNFCKSCFKVLEFLLLSLASNLGNMFGRQRGVNSPFKKATKHYWGLVLVPKTCGQFVVIAFQSPSISASFAHFLSWEQIRRRGNKNHRWNRAASIEHY